MAHRHTTNNCTQLASLMTCHIYIYQNKKIYDKRSIPLTIVDIECETATLIGSVASSNYLQSAVILHQYGTNKQIIMLINTLGSSESIAVINQNSTSSW